MRPVVAAGVALLLLPARALAHVDVLPIEARRGSTITFTVRVPNEEANASTIKLEVFLPAELRSSKVTPGAVAGWTARVAERSVTWERGAISGEQAGLFPLSVSPLPSRGDSLVFKVLQHYDNGVVDRWINPPIGGDDQPNPAPIVKLTGAAPTTTAPTATSNDDGSPTALILLGALLVAGAAAAATRRRRG